jgi:hypothetical protein
MANGEWRMVAETRDGSRVDRRRSRPRVRLLLFAISFLLLTACSAPPITQIGVLAPFEGLYRRSGYATLETTRGVLEAAPHGGAGLMPLALDTSRDARRALEKLSVSPDVGAVVGPLTPQEAAGGAEILGGTPWFAPWAINEQGFVDPAAGEWLQALLAVAANDAATVGARSLAVAGWDAAALPGSVDSATANLALPLEWIDSPLAVRSGDGVLWLGDAALGARFVAALRERLPGTPVWLAPWAADQVFTEHLRAAGLADWKRLYWIVWLDQGYAAWAATHESESIATYVMEQAARQAVAAVTQSSQVAPSWRPSLYELTPSGDTLPAPR